ncbi:Derlin protein [Ceratobasidium theobromae]|uniref:Derlin n=1 Tax=Ceratobasidium theobromae TaxID=1582974 RepID=A0A5N5QF57_9AGAM|nr:Derlin protein [Ceratobasidium theobromae]
MENIPGELRKIPPVTKFLLVSVLAVSIPAMLHLLPGASVVFDPRAVVHEGQVTFILRHGVTVAQTHNLIASSELFLFILNILLLYHVSNDLEDQLFDGHSADYAWQMFLSVVVIMNGHTFSPVDALFELLELM